MTPEGRMLLLAIFAICALIGLVTLAGAVWCLWPWTSWKDAVITGHAAGLLLGSGCVLLYVLSH